MSPRRTGDMWRGKEEMCEDKEMSARHEEEGMCGDKMSARHDEKGM